MNQNTNHKPEVMNLPDAIAAKLAAEEQGMIGRSLICIHCYCTNPTTNCR